MRSTHTHTPCKTKIFGWNAPGKTDHSLSNRPLKISWNKHFPKLLSVLICSTYIHWYCLFFTVLIFTSCQRVFLPNTSFRFNNNYYCYYFFLLWMSFRMIPAGLPCDYSTVATSFNDDLRQFVHNVRRPLLCSGFYINTFTTCERVNTTVWSCVTFRKMYRTFHDSFSHTRSTPSPPVRSLA